MPMTHTDSVALKRHINKAKKDTIKYWMNKKFSRRKAEELLMTYGFKKVT